MWSPSVVLLLVVAACSLPAPIAIAIANVEPARLGCSDDPIDDLAWLRGCWHARGAPSGFAMCWAPDGTGWRAESWRPRVAFGLLRDPSGVAMAMLHSEVVTTPDGWSALEQASDLVACSSITVTRGAFESGDQRLDLWRDTTVDGLVITVANLSWWPSARDAIQLERTTRRRIER